MNHPTLNIVWKVAAKNAAILLLLGVTAVGAFATLGDGRKKSDVRKKSLLSSRTATKPGSFSLKSGYTYRGTQVITEGSKKYISLNTVVTLQKGHTTYIIALKKKVILQNVKIDISNRQLKRN